MVVVATTKGIGLEVMIDSEWTDFKTYYGPGT